MNTETANKHWVETEETAQQRIAQARLLKEGARTGGLKFEVYLTPDLAEWVLDMVEQGDFIDPSEAVFVLMGQAKEIELHQDLKQEVFRRCIAQRIEEAEKGHFYSAEEVWERLDKMIKETTDPVIWQKIVQPDPVLDDTDA
jgi:antitoxin ParD1/3/4